MNLIKINAAAYKCVCFFFGAGLFLIGVKLLLDLLFVKGMLTLVCAGLLILLYMANVTFARWLQVIVILIAVWETIGALNRI